MEDLLKDIESVEQPGRIQKWPEDRAKDYLLAVIHNHTKTDLQKHWGWSWYKVTALFDRYGINTINPRRSRIQRANRIAYLEKENQYVVSADINKDDLVHSTLNVIESSVDLTDVADIAETIENENSFSVKMNGIFSESEILSKFEKLALILSSDSKTISSDSTEGSKEVKFKINLVVEEF